MTLCGSCPLGEADKSSPVGILMASRLQACGFATAAICAVFFVVIYRAGPGSSMATDCRSTLTWAADCRGPANGQDCHVLGDFRCIYCFADRQGGVTFGAAVRALVLAAILAVVLRRLTRDDSIPTRLELDPNFKEIEIPVS